MKLVLNTVIALLIKAWIVCSSFAAAPAFHIPPYLQAVQPASPESAINVPRVEIVPVEPIANRFDVRVLVKGVFTGHIIDDYNEGLLAVHPVTQELFFTEFDYRDQYLPVHLFSVSPNVRNVDTRPLGEISGIPSVEIEQIYGPERYAFYAERMDVDSKGNVFWMQKWLSSPNVRTEKVLWMDSDLQAHYVPLDQKYYFADIQVVRQDMPEWGLKTDDVLVLVSSTNLNRTPSQLLALQWNGNDYDVNSLMENNGIALTIANNQIYSLSKSKPFQIIKHQPESNTVISSLDGLISETPTETPQLEFAKADQAFYVMDTEGEKLIRISEDGSELLVVIDDKQITQIEASPDGNVLYMVVRQLPFLGSIQALYLKGSMEPARSLSALEAGDFNGDSQQNLSDVDTLLRHYLQSTPLSEIDRIFMDINRDGAVTPQDAQDYWLQLQQ